MKKTLLFAGALALIFAFSSCKKDYTCECTTAIDGVVMSTASTTVHDTKKKAEDQCENGTSSYSLFGETYTVNCKIK